MQFLWELEKHLQNEAHIISYKLWFEDCNLMDIMVKNSFLLGKSCKEEMITTVILHEILLQMIKKKKNGSYPSQHVCSISMLTELTRGLN